MSHPEAVLSSILKSRTVKNVDGEVRELRGHIGRSEGQLLRQLIRENDVSDSLEIGCAYGVASLYICQALSKKPNPKHTIVDPLEIQKWEGIGLKNLDRAGISFYEFIEQGSEIALPKLVEEGREFDFIFIDGWHSFDHTFLDLLYSTKLLKVGGIISVDDAGHRPVYKAIKYFSSFPCYKKIGSTPPEPRIKLAIQKAFNSLPKKMLDIVFPGYLTDKMNFERMIALRKTRKDNRTLDWYEHF